MSIPAFEEGDYAVTAVATNNQGDETPVSAPVSFIYDNTAPGEETGTENGGPDTINKPSVTVPEHLDGVIDETEVLDGVEVLVTLPETTQAGDELTLTVTDPNGNSTNIDTTVPSAWNGNSDVSMTIPNTLLPDEGSYSVAVTVTDEAGNSSEPSDPETLNVVYTDTNLTPPSIAIAEAQPDNVVDLAEASDGVQVQVTLPSEAQPGHQLFSL